MFGFAASTLGFVFQMFTLALFVFYILADMPKLRAAVLRRFPPSQQVHIDTVTTITIEKTGGYVYSRAVLAFFSAAFHRRRRLTRRSWGPARTAGCGKPHCAGPDLQRSLRGHQIGRDPQS